MTILIKNIKQTIYFLVIFLIIGNFGIAKGEIYNEIRIIGNERLSVQTIQMFSGLETGIEINRNDLNNSIKELYETDYFKNVEISAENNVITIKIIVLVDFSMYSCE